MFQNYVRNASRYKIDDQIDKEIFNHSLQNWKKNKYSPNPINYPKAGIPKQYLFNADESLLSELKCAICPNLIWNPVECNECGNLFCEYCIKESIRNSGNYCPLCKTSPFNSRQAKGLKRFFNKIRIKCINNNCKEKPEYSDYVRHLENCKYRLYHCNNEGCKYQDTLENIKYHSNECKYRIIKCKYCEKNIKDYMSERHEKTECTQKMECPKCQTSMTRGFFWSKHYSEKDENIDCLKAQIKNLEDLSKKSKEQIEEIKNSHKLEILTLKKEIKKLENEKNIYKKEKEELKKELEEWNTSFKDIYNKLVLKKEKEKKEEQYHTLDNEHKYNTNTYNNYYQMTPKINKKFTYNFKK